MLIAVDAAGGENAPREIVKGAIKAAQENDIDIALVGNKAVLHVLAGREIKKLNLQIFEATEIIAPNEHPMRAVKSKPNSSIVIGTNLVRDGIASAFVSAGNTGAVVCAALLNLGKIEGIERPALGGFLDITPATPTLLIDAGANAECRPSHLAQFAQLGSTYVKHLLDIDSPRVRLLSTGEEETKGNRLAQESYSLLKKSRLNFIGNIEGQDIAKATADVIVTDGFTGNIVLKTIEGMGDTFLRAARQVGYVVATAYHLRGRALLQEIGLGSWAKKADYREYGGACLLGVNGTIIVSHGRSQAKAIKNAIGLAKQTVERDICRIIREGNYEPTDSSN
ncbi:MAG: phosphate acyltransferase PlsX [Dehalococcoidales bacterium]|nr:phosphate acyltransferase PlsX [Dehalococcoidales bacterium]